MRDCCDAQAGFWLNSKFWSKFSRKPLSGIEDQNTPLPHSENFRFGMTSLLRNTPPHPPHSENFRFGMTKVYSGIPPPFGKLQIWDDQSLLRNKPPLHFRKLRIWDDQSLLWNTPPPPDFGKLQIWDDQSLLRNTPPFRKTSDLG